MLSNGRQNRAHVLQRWAASTKDGSAPAHAATDGAASREGDGRSEMLARVAVERDRIEDSVHSIASVLIAAQEAERKRVAAELHDGINQEVAIIAIDLGLLAQRLPQSRDEIRDEIVRIQERAFAISTDIRNLSHNLHPAVIEHLGLCAALRVYCRDFERREGIPVEFSSSNAAGRYNPRAELILYRICQEALSNVRKHASAKSVRVTLRPRQGGLLLTVADDGRGFDPESVSEGMGLVSMWERTRLAGGDVVIRSQLNFGTEVEAFVPLPRSAYGET